MAVLYVFPLSVSSSEPGTSQTFSLRASAEMRWVSGLGMGAAERVSPSGSGSRNSPGAESSSSGTTMTSTSGPSFLADSAWASNRAHVASRSLGDGVGLNGCDGQDAHLCLGFVVMSVVAEDGRKLVAGGDVSAGGWIRLRRNGAAWSSGSR